MTPEIEKRIKAVKAGRVPAGYKKTRVGIVPKEWNVVSFGSISFKTGRKKKKDEDFPIYSINNQKGFCPQSEQFENDGYANTSKDSYTLVEKNTFAYNPARINIGSIGLLKEPEKVIISSLYVCFGLNNQCDLKFFEAYFKSYRFNYDVSNYNEGSVRQYLFYDNFAKINVAVPPLSEQKKIAEILSAQDKIIELKEKLIAEKQRQKKYLQNEILFHKRKKNTTLGDVCSLITKRSSDCQSHYVSTENMVSNYGGVAFSGERKIIEGVSFKEKDMLVANIRPYLKKVWMATVSGICSADVLVLRANKIDPMYLYFTIASDDFVNYVMSGVKGTKMPRGDKKFILKMPIYVPFLPEQHAIAAVLSSADEEISLLQRDLEQEKLKKKSLMQLLLTGLVRV